MKRLLQLSEPFSVLLVRWAPGETDSLDDDQPAKWLARLKGCLRDVDLIGQLADVLYVALLPGAKRREAEALRRRIEIELGPRSPLVLSAAEIKERKDLAGVLAASPGEPTPNERFLALFPVGARPDVESRVFEGVPETDDVSATVLVV
jgi:hypothetical protein